MQCHPDKGGNKEQFQVHQRSFENVTDATVAKSPNTDCLERQFWVSELNWPMQWESRYVKRSFPN
eukprot:1500630-Amphidinium_carterae.1